MAELSTILAEQGLLIATHNQGKLKEIQALLERLQIKCVSAAETKLDEPEEDGDTFAENAMIKSVAAAIVAKMPVLSDDSGLVVPALNGDPGIYSARWAGPRKDFDYAMKSVRIALEAKKLPLDSDAYFVCVLSLALPKGHEISIEALPKEGENFTISTAAPTGFQCINIEGRVYGKLTFPSRGNAGFGYDPIFVANGMEPLTFAEIDPTEKQQISHRANAFKGFLEIL